MGDAMSSHEDAGPPAVTLGLERSQHDRRGDKGSSEDLFDPTGGFAPALTNAVMDLSTLDKFGLPLQPPNFDEADQEGEEGEEENVTGDRQRHYGTKSAEHFPEQKLLFGLPRQTSEPNLETADSFRPITVKVKSRGVRGSQTTPSKDNGGEHKEHSTKETKKKRMPMQEKKTPHFEKTNERHIAAKLDARKKAAASEEADPQTSPDFHKLLPGANHGTRNSNAAVGGSFQGNESPSTKLLVSEAAPRLGSNEGGDGEIGLPEFLELMA